MTEYLGRLKGFGSSIVKPQGQVALHTLINGTEYTLEYLIVPEEMVEEYVLLGEPLRKMARLIFDPDRATVVPLVGTDHINLVKHELD